MGWSKSLGYSTLSGEGAIVVIVLAIVIGTILFILEYFD